MNHYFKPKYECAIRILLAKLEVINAELSIELSRTVITGMSGRLKTWESIEKKAARKGYGKADEKALAAICDIAGVRAVCAYMDDVYRVAKALQKHQDLRIVRIKDYLKMPKSSGYRSLHLIIRFTTDDLKDITAEIQLRTIALDFWACLDHQLRYKRGKQEAGLIGEELREYSSVVADLDRKMVELRNRIAAI